MTEFKILVEDNPTPDDLKRIGRGLNEFNALHAESDNWEQITLFVRNEQQEIVGGLYAERVWDWLEIKIVWIESHLRGLGLGTRLVRAAETEALKRNCRQAMLDTFSFQALNFYRKLGFEVFGKLPDFPDGHTRYFMRKTLNDVPPSS